MKLFEITPKWFFTETPLLLRLLQMYILGDTLILLPFIILLLIIGLFSIKWMMLLSAIFLVCRSLGEMVYWLLHQFGDKTYRPYDFGFKKLDNNAIYILYQLISLTMLVLSTGLVIHILLSW